ncbi:ATP-dependent helicase HrpB [Bowmanella dokdonensis]|uniref:ATP-dependent helicase HrpB n=1 Tax=Bowmanella dokdonensis TaxID=751969 RepID=A0A939IL98_9ALTE|nr:ATP-dependent helicase HrpB [Bowmanella dokdonensis]MBN7823993.1 ATP-dependent helicase HrpB [Bowmanella dokdonensis]
MLPVASLSETLCRTLQDQNVILSAPPGAGKSTYLPLRLLEQEWLAGRKILMLQPRRVAVRAIAGYLAEQLGEPVGHTIGYRIRGEARVSAGTRLEILTEGLLTRLIQQDPELGGVGLIIFDEFHERNLHGDFSLALSLESQAALREDLRLLVMSATLENMPLERILPDAAHLRTEGRSFPVDIRYQTINPHQPWLATMASVIRKTLAEESGSLLAFLPGAGEIRRLVEQLESELPDNVRLYCLYGDLGKEAQMAAIAPLSSGERKLVLATNIAETSLTIEGIRVVVDSGLEKVARFDLNQGITHLTLQKVSQASATQRAGRAGRLGPGICYRLWGEEQHSRLARQTVPQILLADMAPLQLEAAAWGAELTDLPLLDKPTDAQLAQSSELLRKLGALDKNGKITPHGRQLCQLGCHPRLANMLLAAKAMDDASLSLACYLAVLVESKDPLGRADTVSVELRLDYLLRRGGDPLSRLAANWASRLGIRLTRFDSDQAGVLLARAYPDHIAKSRGNGRYLLASGLGVQLDESDSLCRHEYLVVTNLLQSRSGDAKAGLAAPVPLARLKTDYSHLISQHFNAQWDEDQRQIRAISQLRLGKIVLSSENQAQLDEPQLQTLWAQLVRDKGLDWLPMPENASQWLARVRLAAEQLPEFDSQQWTEQALLKDLENWLLPYLGKSRSFKQLAALDFLSLLKNRLDWQALSLLDRELPGHITVPSGSRCALRYEQDGTVTLSVRMQEIYGLAETPVLCRGKIVLSIELLSPARRPLQKTRDLAGFWAGSYKEVQNEMKGRYPKHFWPDDPATAQATTKTKKAMSH